MSADVAASRAARIAASVGAITASTICGRSCVITVTRQLSRLLTRRLDLLRVRQNDRQQKKPLQPLGSKGLACLCVRILR
jgi:hypothetical protein